MAWPASMIFTGSWRRISAAAQSRRLAGRGGDPWVAHRRADAMGTRLSIDPARVVPAAVAITDETTKRSRAPATKR